MIQEAKMMQQSARMVDQQKKLFLAITDMKSKLNQTQFTNRPEGVFK